MTAQAETVVKKIDDGEFAECMPFEIVHNFKVHPMSKTCKHCINRVAPRVIRAYNEAGCNVTEVCIDCILENL